MDYILCRKILRTIFNKENDEKYITKIHYIVRFLSLNIFFYYFECYR